MTKEIWKTVDGWDLYEVSNKGRVRSKDRIIHRKSGEDVHIKGRILHPSIDNVGYPRLMLKQNGVSKHMRVHRLVCQAFVPNPLNKPCVNHIDNDRTNNCVENLEWATHMENSRWMMVQGRNKRTKAWLDKLHRIQRATSYKRVRGTNIETKETIEVECVNRVKEYGFSPGCVSECCNGKMKSHKGYTWEFI